MQLSGHIPLSVMKRCLKTEIPEKEDAADTTSKSNPENKKTQ